MVLIGMADKRSASQSAWSYFRVLLCYNCIAPRVINLVFSLAGRGTSATDNTIHKNMQLTNFISDYFVCISTQCLHWTYFYAIYSHLTFPTLASFGTISHKFLVEEVSMKWMDRPSATEMERGAVYEMEIEISSIHFCDTWSVHPFHVDQKSSKKFLE